MLLINKRQYKPEEVLKLLGVRVPLTALFKKPLFEINPALVIPDRANGPGATKVRQGMDFPAYFRVKLKNGEDVEIRYCVNMTPDPKFEGRTDLYSPKKVVFDGKAEFIKGDEDKALYYYLHFFNKQSPFRQEGSQYFNFPFEYEFQNDAEKADLQIAKIEARTAATIHASKLSDEQIMIIAKGMRIPGVNGMEPRMVKASLMDYANQNPEVYMEKAGSQLNHFQGLIFDAIDSRILILEEGNNIRRWVWGEGPKKDQLIMELPTTSGNHKEALVTHILQTPNAVNEFLPVLMQVKREAKAQKTADTQLAGVDILGMLKEEAIPTPPAMPVFKSDHVPFPPPSSNHENNFASGTDPYEPDVENQTEGKSFEQAVNEFDNSGEQSDINTESNEDNSHESILMLPTSFKESQELLGEKIGKKSPPLAKQLWDGIQSKEIDLYNIDDFIEGLR